MVRSATPSLVFALFLFLIPSLSDAEKDPEVPGHVEKLFSEFARGWVDTCRRNFPANVSRREVRNEEGGVVIRFTCIDDGSVNWRIKPTSSKDTPYVGILTYHRTNLESRGRSRAEAESNGFSATRVVKVTEIFRYSKGAWQQ
jgi:hypothetical protein